MTTRLIYSALRESFPIEKIPEDDACTYELKLDGYRMIAVKSGGKLSK